MASKEQRDFAAALAERLQERARTLLAGDEQVLRLLRDAREQIIALLAAQPSDFQQWNLTRLRQQLDLILQAAGQQAGTSTGQLLQDLWKQGEDIIDKPLGVVGLGSVEMRLGALDVRLLSSMRAFTLDRLTNVTTEAAGKIGQQLGLVTLGAITPFEAIQRVQQILGAATPARASTIVLTETSRAFALASQQRLSQAAALVPGLGKQWRRSGKLHSRWQHDLMDGQVVGADERFKVPSPNGGVDWMLGPHDPAAPAHQVINCGCIALPHKKEWQVMHPGAKPFTALELERDPGKAQLDRQAKAAGLRPEPLAGADRAVIPSAKLAAYALNPDHPVGGHKARVLASALGYTTGHADDLAKQLLAGLKHQPATMRELDAHGQRWMVDIPVTGPAGSATVRTGWIVRPGSDSPQLTSARLAPQPKPKRNPS